MLIAIDGSTRATGFAFGGPADGVPRGGVWTLPGADEAVFDRTLALVHDSVLQLAQLVRANYLYVEAPMPLIDETHSAFTALVLIQLTGAIRAAAHRAGCIVVPIAVSTVRKHFIGRGNLRRAEAKQAVMDRCRQLGWPIHNNDGKDDDNRADSCAVWAYGMAIRYPSWSPKSTPLFQEGRASA